MSILASKKERAIELRRKGRSYSEILEEVPVAKSTLSLWLREVGLSKQQKQRLTDKKRLAQIRGGLARKTARIRLQNEIYKRSRIEISNLTRRELWLVGIALYWAEGAKEKEHCPGSGVKFSNSDPRMISLFLRWLDTCCGIEKSRIYIDIYVHEIYKNRLRNIIKYWSDVTGFPTADFNNVYFKKHNIKTIRKNRGNLYNGLLRVNVRASSELNRRIAGWIMGIYGA